MISWKQILQQASQYQPLQTQSRTCTGDKHDGNVLLRVSFAGYSGYDKPWYCIVIYIFSCNLYQLSDT